MESWDVDKVMPMREHVYRHLKGLILEGKYKAGDRLIERELAKEMNISRTPIREALFRLEAQGFVKTVPRKGVVVETISRERIIEIFDILSVLEGLASEMAARKVNEEMVEKCQQNIESIQRFLDDRKDKDIEAFHLTVCDFLYQAAKSPKLYFILVDLTEYIQAFANAGYKKKGRLKEAMKEHVEILKAIKEGDAEKAKKLSIAHIEKSKSVYLSTLS